MNKLQTFQEFVASQTLQIGIWSFIISLILTFLASYLLALFYRKYAKSLSNRKRFAENLIMVSMTTMIIITIIKSSLALSLGLVGALSIIRFRTAIKEPEELSYLFLAVAVGVGLGAYQIAVTLIGLAAVLLIIRLRGFYSATKGKGHHNLFLTVSSASPPEGLLERIASIINKYCVVADMKRVDEAKENLEATFLVEFDRFEQLESAKRELRQINDSVRITFLDNKGIM